MYGIYKKLFNKVRVSDGRGKDYESVLVAQFIHAYAKHKELKWQETQFYPYNTIYFQTRCLY